jgi:eukaryotic-like serine/threonine-protein kinase
VPPDRSAKKDGRQVMTHDVFISYATEDKRVADAVCAAVEARGFRCWIAPRDVLVGMPYGEAIIKAIQGCRAMVLVFSSHANTSPHIPKEVERAVSKGMMIVPFRIEDVAPAQSLDYFIGSVHWLDAIGGPLDGHLARLADAVDRTLAGDGSGGAKPAAEGRPWRRRLSSLPAAAAEGIRTLGRQPAILSVCALLLGAVIAGLAVWNLKPTAQKPVTRTVIDLPVGDRLAALDYPAIAISADGTQLAYVAFHGGTRQIYLRSLDNLETKPLLDTDGAYAPFFSPDGKWLGFAAAGKLKKISVNGSSAVTLGNAPSLRGSNWGNQGVIAFTPDLGWAIQQVSEAGGASHPLTRLENGETGHVFAEFLPGNKALLFATVGANPGIAAQSLSSGERRNLIPGGTSPRYAASGYLLYMQSDRLMAAPFDPQGLQITGPAVPLADGILPVSSGGATYQYSISATGSLVYIRGAAPQTERRLVWVGRNGAEQALAMPPRNYNFPRISPDGRRLSVAGGDGLWLYDFARETLIKFTPSGTWNTWMPDGKRIAFAGNPTRNLFWQLADGSAGPERLTTSEYAHAPGSFSPDGQLLAFAELNPTTGYDLWVLRLSDRKAEPFLRTPFNEGAPSFSPDGHWLAYVSDESGRYEIYVQPYPGPGGKHQVSTEGGTEPVWNRNGKELFYRSGNSRMMAADLTTQPSFSLGQSKMLFQGEYMRSPGTVPEYDVSGDGQRFLMIKPTDQTLSLNQIVVVQNAFEELKRSAPAGTK